MKIRSDTIRSIDDYVTGFPEGTKRLLVELRQTIRTAAPRAEEKIRTF